MTSAVTGMSLPLSQGTFATMAVWSGSSLNASAVVQAGPQHRAPVGADVAGTSRERHAAEPILAPFAGLATEERVSGGSGGLGTSVSTTTIVLRAAHVTLTSADGSLRLSFQEWHLVQSSPSSPGGGTLRPVRAVELPSFCLGGRSEMHMLRAEAGVEEDSAFGSSAAQRAGPAVAVWSHGCAATWAGCQPGAAVWRLPSDADDAIRKDGGGNSGGLGGRNGGGGDEGEDEQGGTGGVGKQYRASAALERCLAGATRRAAAVLPLRSGAGANAGVKRLLVLTHDHALLHVDTKLFMTAAVEPAPINIAAASEGAVGVAGETVAGAETEGEVEPCPICLEDPGGGGTNSDADAEAAAAPLTVDDLYLSEFDLQNSAPVTRGDDRHVGAPAVALAKGRGDDVLRVPCCSRAFCRGCLRDYLRAFPRGACPHCRDVRAFTALGPTLGIRAASTDEPAPWREVSLAIQLHARRTADTGHTTTATAAGEASVATSLLDPTFLRGIEVEETATGAGVGDFAGGDGRDNSRHPAAPSYVGYMAGLQGDDHSLVQTERVTVAADDISGSVAVLTRHGAVVLDARGLEATLEAEASEGA